jgi:hypothetical protein
MKANNIFLIKTLSESKHADKMFAEIAYYFEDGDEDNFAVEDVGGLDYIFLRFSEYKVKRICKILEKYINYSVENISDRIILGNEGELKEIIEVGEFKGFFDIFRLESASIEDVLDKILLHGVNSLDEVDRAILLSSHNRENT